MKLSSVFAQYLYQNKKLNLPGIGSFEIDRSVSVPDSNDKNVLDFGQYIRFTNKNIAKPDDEFIDFIRIHTGKIRPLAESDLDSYLSDGKLLLNIGKPFFLEGIGTLQKAREGTYEFVPGTPVMERLEGDKGGEKSVKKRPAFDSGYSQIEPENNNNRKALVGVVLALGLAAVIWGGYSLYNRNTEPLMPAAIEDREPQVTLPADTGTAVTRNDSATVINDAPAVATAPVLSTPGSYRYILEIPVSKTRALKRINQLALVSPRIMLRTDADSTSFMIYVDLPGSQADTARIKDSLNAWYWGRKEMRVSIAQ
ncbi:MAG: hypothetical protein EOO04_06885 [Chitinophagaceae bacterium]|nr:MAG: hypothetical protein EOO04_06885 [Chitinophagaceae bacterium]